MAEVIRARQAGEKFSSLANFLERVSFEFLNKKMMEALAMSGALDQLGERKQIINSIDRLTGYAKSKQAGAIGGQLDIFGLMDEKVAAEVTSLQLEPCAPATRAERLLWEKELLGMYVSENPLLALRRLYRGKSVSSKSLKQEDEGKRKRLVGILSNVKRITTKNGEEMAFAALEDLGGKIELVVFPRVYQEIKGVLAVNQPVHVRGKVSTRDAEIKLLVDVMERAYFSEDAPAAVAVPLSQSPTQIFAIQLPGDVSVDKLQQLKELLQQHQGDTECVIHLNKRKRIKVPFRVTKSAELEAKVAELVA
ncbi:MAG: hypothetical protein A2788_01375 [Candidatus Abawacabacteria bacterium RIFCSPHIGHO2_01_FULL_46_8]|uniref:OB domain-containing protein n=1 Tax=Candidatus Abawacabacteria bacterium RIFCSPHIGHO2_01_FULL_46_8 TaxID=1817815 RepID=A0A1F4XP34_9BACT|nr:MAG: hypothetical protein A2788_01375 [Candidatus Abawacabacteria bacterium RIFCSPHIGHO2_01_FULL_46_8]